MKLFVHLKRYIKECILAPLLKMLECAVDLSVPIITANIIDRGITGGDTNYIYRGCLLMVLLGLAGLAVSVTAQYFSAKAAVGFSSELRKTLFSHIQSLDFSTRRTIGSDTLITRLTSDINQVQNGLNLFLRLAMRSPFIVFGSIIMAYAINKKLTLIFIAATILLATVVFFVMKVTTPLFSIAQAKLDNVVGITRSNLSGVRVIRAFNREESELHRFENSTEELASVQVKAGMLSALTNPITGLIINLGIIALLYSGALSFSSGTLTRGEVVALVNYMGQISVELIKLANLIIQVTRALACAGRVSAALETHSGIGYPNNTLLDSNNIVKNNASVIFDSVSLRYPGAGDDSLTDISFIARNGETIGVIGGTGSGKSSLVNLIPRFYDATQGNVSINGKAVTSYDKESLRAKVGIVPQKSLLFTGTIRSNLLWGDNIASDDELWAALALAQAADFVHAKPNGLDEIVEQGGRNFSGGQKQRLCIARALVKLNAAKKAGLPFILILDDSASALDFATDARLRSALTKLASDTSQTAATIFIVSQRVSSVRNADKILVLDDGNLVGQGTHEELLISCHVYHEICESQFGIGKEESHGA